MKIAHCRLAVLMLTVFFVLGILPLMTGAVHMEEAQSACELDLPQAEPVQADTAVNWGFEALALLLSACGALVRQVIRIRNG